MIDTVLLAGGMSKRFTRNKLQEMYKGKPLIVHTIEPFLKVSNKVIIVTGHYDVDYIFDYMSREKIIIVHNEKYKEGMFTSVQRGVQETTGNFFIIPGDYPLVKVSTLNRILTETGLVRVPTFHQRKGHPIYFSYLLKGKLLSEESSSNLKVFRDKHEVTYIEVPDPGILLDIDHEKDYKMLKERNE